MNTYESCPYIIKYNLFEYFTFYFIFICFVLVIMILLAILVQYDNQTLNEKRFLEEIFALQYI